MPTTRRTFHRGIMDKDTDARLTPDGVARHLENVNTSTSEGSDEGSVENMLSNKRLTNINFGTNPVSIGKFEDKSKNKLYWFVVSDIGSYLLEFNQNTSTAVVVLEDTRPIGERVFDLNKDFYITGIQKIVSEVDNKDLLLWTDNNLDICCINIERAKTYGPNGFEKEDIFLIKRPPFYAPKTQFIFSESLSNNIEERFFSFAYRYKYLDGEYSAISSFSNYKFNPKQFALDYDTLENLGMVNSYNSVRISFDIGDKRVTDIQIIAKSSNSNNLYIIETFNKEKEGWNNSELYSNQVTKTLNFSNNKLYALLPEKELYRLFDNVPRKAKALTIAGNRPILGNYLEGYNLEDNNQQKIQIDITPFINAYELDGDINLIQTEEPLQNKIVFSVSQDAELKEGFKIVFYFYITYFFVDGLTPKTGIYLQNSFEYILNQDYDSLEQIWADEDFQSFISVVNSLFQAQDIPDIPDGWVEEEKGEIILVTNIDGSVGIQLKSAKYKNTFNEDEEQTIVFRYNKDTTEVSVHEIATASSLHSNRDVEIVIIYIDEFGRQTIGLSSKNNTTHIPQSNSVTQNKLGVRIDNRPPYWAVAYKIGVKTAPLTYQTLYVTKFYNENTFVWCKLEGDNKDKVKEGDVLILKVSAGTPALDIVKIKVLEVKTHEEDFIIDNVDSEGEKIKEEAGVYMKIKPKGFVMSFDNYGIYQTEGVNRSSGFPIVFVELFTTFDDEDNPVDIEIPEGSEIYIYMLSNRKYDDGWSENIYEMTHFAQRNYDNIEEWFSENILDRTLYGNKGNATDNYEDNLEIIRGTPVYTFGVLSDVIPDEQGGLYLKVKGTKSGGSKGRKGGINVQIRVRTTDGFYVFETEPSKETDLNIFYQSEETYWIHDGNHKAVTTDKPITDISDDDQDVSIFKPAQLELSFYNCFAFGNGVESYKIKDAFNSNFLNVDLKPTTTSVEEYKEVRRYADQTYGEPYIESANVNGINEFNASTANWKELDKQDGEIQIMYAREGDILTIQKNKWKKILYGKDILFNADGTTNLSAIPQVLGQEIPYGGEYGMTDPESFAVEGSRCYGVDKERGVVLRLSVDGLTPIVYGMKDWFRDVFHNNNKARVIGGIDPYHKLYQITIGDQPQQFLELQCNNTISKYNQNTPFTYKLKLNSLSGDVVLNYNILSGNVTITATFDGETYVKTNVTGTGNLTFERTSLIENIVIITVTPIGGAVNYEIGNTCPLGKELKIVSIILNDSNDIGKTMTNRFRWGSSVFYETNDLFDNVPCSRFQIETGIEGVGKFPSQGSLVNVQAFKDSESSGNFKISDCNKLAYLITDEVYDESDIDTILENANFLSLSTIGQGGETQGDITQGSFVFNRSSNDDILYLIWDYRDAMPVFSDNRSFYIVKGDSITLKPLISPDPTIEISVETEPEHGTVSVDEDNITYTHDDSMNFEDSFVLSATVDNCVATATYDITILPNCSNDLSFAIETGISERYVALGELQGTCGISYYLTEPTLIEIWWNGDLKATTGTKITGTGTLTFNKDLEDSKIAIIKTQADGNGSFIMLCPNT